MVLREGLIGLEEEQKRSIGGTEIDQSISQIKSLEGACYSPHRTKLINKRKMGKGSFF